MPERPVITITNRAWIREPSVPNALLDDFYYETTEKVQDEKGFWVEAPVPIDLVIDSKCGKYLGFPRGNLDKVLQHFNGCRIVDKRSVAPLGFDLELNDAVTEDPRWPEQVDLLDQWYAAGGGVLKAPAGSGKSVIGVAMTCRLGLRTLFLFDRKDFRDQWLDEFHRHTNLTDLEHVAGEPLAGAFKAAGRKYLQLWPITFATFQQLNTRRVKKFMRDHRDYFGMVICDETHHVASPTYRAAVLRFNPFILGGVTATPERKDELEDVYYDVLGPITARGGSEQLNPLVWLVYTGFEVTPNPYRADHVQFTLFLNQIAKSKPRNELVVRNVLRHLNKGRCPLIVSERVEHCHKLAKMLGDSGWSRDRIAVAVGDTKDRKALYKGVDHGRYDCLIASKVIDEGVNVIRLDTLHLATPLASRARIEQRSGRIRRPYTETMLKRWGKKPRPEIWDYIDEGHGVIHGSAYARQHVYAKIGAEVRDRRTGLVVRINTLGKKRRGRRY
ncbi:MAG: DEAD/DEAH box helicase family protein [Anaerolineae bacterium]|nr:DEAD/DEAH box helicase family protein [Thermoplasmata archaeon]NIV34245.1 DEAD/DEAH box helicase family protein [Anaerolineae bacterium]NIY06094.1 DEAD/DEAH box helicase family protein [Thermoplasmata archaeon]